MDKVKSKKLTSVISRLTVAANRAVRKTNEHLDTRKHYVSNDFHTAMGLHLNEQRLNSSKLTK